MDFEWDESKRLANVAKHGIDFSDAVQIFEGNFVEARTDAITTARFAFSRPVS